MEAERKTIQEKIEALEKQRADLDTQITEAQQGLIAIQAYFDAKDGKPKKKVTRAPRKSGVRDELRNLIASNPTGISRADILKNMNAEDKKSQQSISNALQALKKQNIVTSLGGQYKVA
jgi:hypothetical protein